MHICMRSHLQKQLSIIFFRILKLSQMVSSNLNTIFQTLLKANKPFFADISNDVCFIKILSCLPANRAKDKFIYEFPVGWGNY